MKNSDEIVNNEEREMSQENAKPTEIDGKDVTVEAKIIDNDSEDNAEARYEDEMIEEIEESLNSEFAIMSNRKF